MNRDMRRDETEVAVIGAGPYGLAAATFLRAAGIETRVFGEPMSFWRCNMPKGMMLRSTWDATHIPYPIPDLSLDAFAQHSGMKRANSISLDEFVRYGEWVQNWVAPDLDRRSVTRLDAADEGFRLLLSDGTTAHARRVVVATGLANQDYRPSQFGGLPPALVSHTCEHSDLGKFRAQRVAVIGRGQSACESATLLSEAGAEVEQICRGDIHWLGSTSIDGKSDGDLYWHVHERLATRSGVGPFPLNWLAEWPRLIYRVPNGVRQWTNVHSLRPGATAWLRPRSERVVVNVGRTIESAQVEGDRIALQLDNGRRTFDHVLLATGYRIDISKLGFLPAALLGGMRMRGGSPALSAGFESSVRGLHFVGSSAVASFGALMRFVAGAGYAGQAVARAADSGRVRDAAAASAWARSPRPASSAAASVPQLQRVTRR